MTRNERHANGRCGLYVLIALGLMLVLATATPGQYNKLDPGNNDPPPAGAILDLNGMPIPLFPTFQQYTVNFQATLPNTDITFAFREDPAFILFSNASVVDTANPSVNLLTNGNFAGGVITSNGNSLTPFGWTYANVFGATFGGQVVASCGVGGAFCWDDGAVQAYDAISQTISTIVGHTYQISFFVSDNGGPGNFSDVSTNGNTTGTGGNGRNVTVYAQAGLPSSGSTTQMQTTPPQNFNTTTDTPVPVVFNNTPGQHVELDVVFPASSDPLTFPIGPPVEFQATNRFVSDANPYTGGTAFATAKPFVHAGNGAGNGAKFEVICGDATHAFSEANCPFPSVGSHIRAEDKFDLPTDAMGNFIQPVITPGTTVEMVHWFPNLGGANSTSWQATSTIPHPDCPNMFQPNFACDIEGTLVNKWGKSNGFGSDTKKGDYLLVYNVPIPCTAVKVNGVPVNTPCIQGNSPFFFHSPLTFDFMVSPAQCPTAMVCGNGWTPDAIAELFSTFDPVASAPDLPNMLIDLTDTNPPNCPGPGLNTNTNCPVPNGTSCPGTNCALTSGTPGVGPPAAPVEFTTTAMNENEGQDLLQFSAGTNVRIRERIVQLLTDPAAQCPNPPQLNEVAATPPCYSTTLPNVPITVDNTNPTISSGPTLSTPGSPMVTVTYTCSDTGSALAADNSGIAICGATPPGTVHNVHALGGPGAGPASVTEVDTLPSAIGSYSFTVQATDVAGNLSAASQVNYTIYRICALYDQTKAVHSGATIPVKFFLCDSTGAVDLSSASIVVHATGLFQQSSSTSDPVVDDGNANPDNDFRFDSTLGPSGGYIFNLKTTGLGSGNWVIQFTVTGTTSATTDPTLHALGFGVK